MSKIGPYDLGFVHLGESLDLLRAVPDESVDALVTDPPYSSGGFTRSDRAADVNTKYERSAVEVPRMPFSGDNRDGRSWHYWTSLWLSECWRALKPGAYAMVFTDWRQLPTTTDAIQSGGFQWRGLIAWNKGESARAPHTGYVRHQCEFVVWGSKGPLGAAEHGGPWPGCLSHPVKQDDKHHLTGKPTALMRDLVRMVPPGGVVLDPFSGSGTTGVGCMLEGRRFVGFEREPHYVAVANSRLDSARASVDVQSVNQGQAALFGGST